MFQLELNKQPFACQVNPLTTTQKTQKYQYSTGQAVIVSELTPSADCLAFIEGCLQDL